MSGIPAERRPKRPNAGIPRKRFDEDESDEVEGRKETGSAVLNEKRARTGNNDPREGDSNSAQTRGELVLVMDTSEAGCTLETSPAGPSRRDETGGIETIDVAASAATPASALRDADSDLNSDYDGDLGGRHEPDTSSEHDSTFDSDEDDPISETRPPANSGSVKSNGALNALSKLPSVSKKVIPIKKRSKVWKHYEDAVFDEKGQRVVECPMCKLIIPFHGATTVLANHMLKIHGIDINKDDTKDPGKAPAPKLLQPTMFQVMQAPHPEAKQLILQLKVLRFIIENQQPFSVVDNRSFREMLFAMDCRFVPISANKLTQLCFRQAIQERMALTDLLAEVQYVAMTTDLWTSKASEPYIGITAHFANEGHSLSERTLACREIPYPHSSENIAKIIFEIAEQFKISKKLVSLTCDGASNMQGLNTILHSKYSISELSNASKPIPYFWCFGHLLNLVVQQALKSSDEVVDLITKVRNLAKFFKGHPKQMEALQRAQQILNKNGPFQKPKIDVVTRWNSILAMLQSALSLLSSYEMFFTILNSNASDDSLPANERREARNVLESTKDFVLQPEDKRMITDLIFLLEPFQVATEQLSGASYVTVSMVEPITTIIIKHLESDPSRRLRSPGLIKVRNELLDNSLRRFSESDTTMSHIKAVALDPRYYFLATADSDALRSIKELLKERVDPPANGSEDDHPMPKSSATSGFDFSKQLLKLKEEAGPQNSVPELDEYNAFVQMCALYEKQKATNADYQKMLDNPLLFWETNKATFKTLYGLASRLFVMQATSVSSERLFSSAGNVITENRSSLDPETVDAVMVLSSAYKYK